MLTIRDEQFKALSNAHLERDLVRYLRQRFPTTLAQKTDAELHQIGRSSRELGLRHDITTDRDIGTIADFIVMYGPDFEKQPWANEVFRSSALSGPDKMEILRARSSRSGVHP